MKQFIVGLLVLASSFAPFSAFAAGSATLGFSQQTISVVAGETVDLLVTFNANAQEIDTVRANITFDSTIVSVEAVSLVGPFDRNTPGNFYDSQTGKISWGGFTLDGPVNTASSFAKITFYGKQAGDARILMSADSKMISGGEEKIDTKQLGSATVSVKAAPEADPSLSLITVNSPTQLNDIDWYSNDVVEVEWTELKGDSAIASYLYSFDESSNTNPTTFAPATKTSAKFTEVKDGVHYFHIKGLQKNGKTTKTVHRRFNIDATKPNSIALTVSETQLLEGESVWLTFATTDETSGVVQYQVAINSSDFLPQVSPMELTDLAPGTYFLRVSAIDRAGNTTYQGQSVRVYPKGTQINRSEGYNPDAEIEAITNQEKPTETSNKKNQKLLITLVLVVLAAFGIIYAFKRKKIK